MKTKKTKVKTPLKRAKSFSPPSPQSAGFKRIKIEKELRPQEVFGQNFLINPLILDREIAYASVCNKDHVLEIGAGIGNLTERLCKRAASVYAFEVDLQYKHILSKLERKYPNLTVRWEDALDASFPEFGKVVANLPYNISLPLIFKVLQHRFHTAVFIIQHRLAKRITARPGQPGYSRISILLQRVAGVRQLETIKKQNFFPEPAVTSAMIRLRPSRPQYPMPDEEYFKDFLGYVFLRRDGSLLKALSDLEKYNEIKKAVDAMPKEHRNKPVYTLPGPIFGGIASELYQAGVHMPHIDNDIKKISQSLLNK